jgi:hypothetical protein
MKRFAGMVLAGLVASAGPSLADKAKQFLELYTSEDGQALAIAKISSMEAGMHEVNAYLVAHNEKPLYCQPAQLVLTGSQTADMIKRAADEKGSKIEDMTIPGALLFVLQRTFPCP